MKCLIIAAGRGWRLRSLASSKPLYPVARRPLIEHVINSAFSAGVKDFVVVTGYDGETVRQHLNRFALGKNASIEHCINDDWERGNGTSVLCAREVLREPFLLLMSDHLFDPAIASAIMNVPLSDGEVVLAVDYRIHDSPVDLDDVTRVYAVDGMIREIGKHLPQYNAFDTGVFHCTPTLFDAIEESVTQTGDASLTGGMKILAARGKARTFDIEDRFWMDVDGPEDARRAEDAIRTVLDRGT